MRLVCLLIIMVRLFQFAWVKIFANLEKHHLIILQLVLALPIIFVIFSNISSDQVSSANTSCRFRKDCIPQKKSKNGDWKYQSLENWTLDQMIDYLLWTNSSSCVLAHDFGGVVTFGIGIDGQKSVCLDPTIAPDRTSGYFPIAVKNKSSECLVYSIGINNEWSFDEAMQDWGCRVYSFDPSMNMTNHNHTEKIHFYNLGLSDIEETWPSKTLNGNDWMMTSLDFIYYKLLHHENRIIDYLKIDIEGGEWKALPQIMSSGMLKHVRQLGLEVHLIPEEETRMEVIRQRINLVKKLEDVYGFIRFDSKYSLWGWTWKAIDDYDWIGYTAYEMAFYNSKLIRPSVN